MESSNHRQKAASALHTAERDRSLAATLSPRRRRTVVRLLDASAKSLTLPALARRVAAEENGVSASVVASELANQVALSLYNNHLRVLNLLDVVSCDRERAVVAPGRRFGAALEHVSGGGA